MNYQTQTRRSAFTLVELLVVITIIAMLAVLVAKAVAGAMWKGKQTAIKTELDQIDGALKSFKEKYGAYPPCNLAINFGASNPATTPLSTSPIAVDAQKKLQQFLTKACKKYKRGNDLNLLNADLVAAGVNTAKFDPGAALVFWLGGLSPDVTNPFGIGQRTPLFGFDKLRLTETFTDSVVNNGIWDNGEPTLTDPSGGTRFFFGSYKSQYSNAPIVYFDFRNYADPVASTATVKVPNFFNVGASDQCCPYARTATGNPLSNVTEWMNADSFQLIAAGQDNTFTGAQLSTCPIRIFPAGTNYTPEDDDNVTNFSNKSALTDEKP